MRKIPLPLLSLFLASLCILVVMHTGAQAVEQADNLLVNKSHKTLQLQKNGLTFAVFKIALGKNPIGHKQQQGDGRTPEGVYFIEEKKADSAFYKALKISYPNAADRESAKKMKRSPGGQIMIHGQKNGYGWGAYVMQQRNWTDGCIALTNQDLDKVWQAVQVGTRIEILP
jgi:murein L,D-transpeptidase YafK